MSSFPFTIFLACNDMYIIDILRCSPSNNDFTADENLSFKYLYIHIISLVNARASKASKASNLMLEYHRSDVHMKFAY